MGWRLFLRAHSQVLRQLEAELMAGHGLPLPWYDVLLQLAESPDRRLCMTELAQRVLLSRSGLTRLVDRVEKEGLVSRAPCPSDMRATYAVLTEAGLQRLREASPTHLRSISEHVTGRLDARDMVELERLMTKLMPETSLSAPLESGESCP